MSKTLLVTNKVPDMECECVDLINNCTVTSTSAYECVSDPQTQTEVITQISSDVIRYTINVWILLLIPMFVIWIIVAVLRFTKFRDNSLMRKIFIIISIIL